MSESNHLVFGDLHGRVLPAFRLAAAWARETSIPIAGILQAGDLGYFPDLARLDRATARFAEKDPMELGVQLVTEPSAEADGVFLDDGAAPPSYLWFCPGNHEDFAALAQAEHGVDGTAGSFPVDHYGRVWCIRDGMVEALPGGLRVAALWGIEHIATKGRAVPSEGRIRQSRANQLAGAEFDILLTHDGPRDAIFAGAGSTAILDSILGAQPAFAFFGHYEREGAEVQGDFGATRVFHLGGFTMKKAGGHAEPGSVGLLRWPEGRGGTFDYLDPAWLKTFGRWNWRHR